jgi:23S rRNA (adenine2030-N6)-methyltransferase
MNYRHAFHAANFADCFKHAVFAAALTRLMVKPGGLFVLETHAGTGLYDLTSDEARRSPEWQEGLGRLSLTELPKVFAAWIEVIARLNTEDDIKIYPGSPLIAAHMLRGQDRYAGCELHPEDAARLRRRLSPFPKAQAHERNGWEALKGLLPPPEKRGFILIDPPFEGTAEHLDLAAGITTARQRFPQAGIIAWRPLKDETGAARYLDDLKSAGLRDITTVELRVGAPGKGMLACALDLISPPWGLREDAAEIAATLAERLARDESAGFQIREVVPE